MRSISESYRECARNYACQEGRNFAPVQTEVKTQDADKHWPMASQTDTYVYMEKLEET